MIPDLIEELEKTYLKNTILLEKTYWINDCRESTILFNDVTGEK